MDLGVANLITTIVLAAITAWYAWSTAKMLGELKKQADAARAQLGLMSKSAQIAAWAALMEAAGHPAGQNPFERLRALVAELERLESAVKTNAG